MYANAHAEFLSRWAPLSAFRAAMREEDDAADRSETPHTYTRKMQNVCSGTNNYADTKYTIRWTTLMTLDLKGVTLPRSLVPEQTIFSSSPADLLLPWVCMYEQ